MPHLHHLYSEKSHQLSQADNMNLHTGFDSDQALMHELISRAKLNVDH